MTNRGQAAAYAAERDGGCVGGVLARYVCWWQAGPSDSAADDAALWGTQLSGVLLAMQACIVTPPEFDVDAAAMAVLPMRLPAVGNATYRLSVTELRSE
ncbi:hypothetical protein AB4305_11315 [Nocardia sp. 2YAB30]|uniref:hypothetical protein n=1 Tax=unclassified Nocardia TaxID=2637762 RepID=UPI003F9C4A6E